jgi:hypothetical protein
VTPVTKSEAAEARKIDYSTGAHKPIRFLAKGRDVSATIDSALLGTPGSRDRNSRGTHRKASSTRRPLPARDHRAVMHDAEVEVDASGSRNQQEIQQSPYPRTLLRITGTSEGGRSVESVVGATSSA